MKPDKVKTFYRRNLPHIQPIGSSFFVTFRLKDSIPRAQLWKLKKDFEEKIALIKQENPTLLNQVIYNERKLFFAKYDLLLDQCNSGPTFLKDPRIAELVANELHRFDDDLYDLIAYTIMPNHVHILINTAIQISTATNIAEWETLNIKPLDQIMKRIKGPSAIYANRLLKRSGKFWQKESFDHYIRNEKEFHNIINYILSNPMKANLVSDWMKHPFTFLQCNRPF